VSNLVIVIGKNAITNDKRFQLAGMFFSLQAKEKGRMRVSHPPLH
jgi:hypothetical protein